MGAKKSLELNLLHQDYLEFSNMIRYMCRKDIIFQFKLNNPWTRRMVIYMESSEMDKIIKYIKNYNLEKPEKKLFVKKEFGNLLIYIKV